MKTRIAFSLCRLRPVVLAAVAACAAAAHGQALPSGATVVNGTAGINTFSNGMQVINSPGAIIHWDSFSIGNGRTVRFDQLTSQSAVLNRVTGNAHSEILGTLQSNGRVFLLNPNGILFGAGARVDVAGLLASTLNISDADFLAGNYRFRCFNATVCESGVDTLNPFNNRIVLKDGSQITTRTAGEGGQVWLIARDRITSEKGSKVEAPSGQVMAAAAREVTITSPALGNMTFTLTGTAGSRIDLEGDIDVPRGAAGFFADTIRLAGGVRALSDINAAGQIVALAANEIIVDGDARLDVSGTDGADAGAVRLKAVRNITVHATSETAADSGEPTAQRPSPMGGLIELEAYQVSLPWEVYGDYGRAPLHAYGRGAQPDDFSRYGNVRINESGTFTFASVSIPLLFSAGSVYDHTTEDVISSHSNMESLITASRSGNGNILVVTNAYGNRDAGDRSVNLRVRTISPAGQVISETTLGPTEDLYASSHAVALSGGGWLVWSTRPAAVQDTYINTAWVLNGQGAVVREFVPVADANVALQYDSIWSLQGGGFAVSTVNGSVTTTQVYSATGQVEPSGNVQAALASRTTLQISPYLYRDALGSSYVNYNPALKKRVVYGEWMDGEAPRIVSWDIADARSNQVVWTSPFVSTVDPAAAGMTAMGTTFVADPAIPRLRNFTSSVGIFDAQGQAVGTLGALSAFYVDSGVTPQSNSTDTRAIPLGSDTLFGVETTDYSITGYAGSGGRQTDYGGSMRFVMAQRTAQAMPVASAGAQGSVLAPLLLATAPGLGNGVQQGGSGPVTPPVDPGPAGGPPAAAPQGELPAPAYFSPTRGAAGFELASSPMGVPAARTNADKAETEEEFLAYAGDFVEGLLGKSKADALRRATTPEERAPIMQEAAYAIAVGEDIYKATSSMGQEMRGTLFNSWAGVQLFGLEDEKGFSEGLHRALTQVRPGTPNEDGSPGAARTRLQVPLDVLELELKQATTEEEKTRIGRRVLRQMVLAAREEAGNTVDAEADLELPDGKGGTVRITDDGDLVREEQS